MLIAIYVYTQAPSHGEVVLTLSAEHSGVNRGTSTEEGNIAMEYIQLNKQNNLRPKA